MKPLLKVRTVTLGLSLLPNQPDAWDLELARAAAFVSSARRRLEDAGYEVQTTRISSQSFESWVDVSDATAALEAFRRLDATLLRLGVGLFNAGPATSPEGLALVPQIVALGPRISASGAMPGPLDRAAASRLADAILTISQTTAGGEGNFQFCASFNVPPKATEMARSAPAARPLATHVGVLAPARRPSSPRPTTRAPPPPSPSAARRPSFSPTRCPVPAATCLAQRHSWSTPSPTSCCRCRRLRGSCRRRTHLPCAALL